MAPGHSTRITAPVDIPCLLPHLAGMDAQRAVARRMVIGLPPGGIDPAWERDFSAYAPAGVIVFRPDFRDLEDLRPLTARLPDLAPPRRRFIALDEEGGSVHT